MYPKAADLISRESQSYSDQEAFWIIKNGIRLSGMPAFGEVESDERIWDLVFYFRFLPHVSNNNKDTNNKDTAWKAPECNKLA